MLGDLICKLFLFVLKLFKSAVTAVGEALKIVAEVLIDVLDDVVSSIAGSGPITKLLTFTAVGVGLWWLLTSDDEKEEKASNVIAKMP